MEYMASKSILVVIGIGLLTGSLDIYMAAFFLAMWGIIANPGVLKR